MIIDYDGRQYPFDMDDVTIKQAIRIEKYMGCSFADWGKMLSEGQDLKARQALGWLILTGGDLTLPVEDTDFKMVALGQALNEAFAEDAPPEAEGEPVPTGAVSNGHAPEAALSPVNSQPSSAAI